MSTSDAISMQCESCGRKMKIPVNMAGGKGQCPACKATFEIPGAATWQPVEKVLPRRKSEEELVANHLMNSASAELHQESGQYRETIEAYTFLSILSSLYFLSAIIVSAAIAWILFASLESGHLSAQFAVTNILGGGVLIITLAASGEFLKLIINVAANVQRQAISARASRELLERLVNRADSDEG